MKLNTNANLYSNVIQIFSKLLWLFNSETQIFCINRGFTVAFENLTSPQQNTSTKPSMMAGGNMASILSFKWVKKTQL